VLAVATSRSYGSDATTLIALAVIWVYGPDKSDSTRMVGGVLLAGIKASPER